MEKYDLTKAAPCQAGSVLLGLQQCAEQHGAVRGRGQVSIT